MGQSLSQIDGIELLNDDITTGFNHPDLVLTFARKLGLGGSTSRSTTVATALSAYLQLLEETGNVPTTIAAAATSTTANTSILPANSLILMVIGRVTVAIPTAATFSVGSAGQATRFATGISTALNTTFVAIDQFNPANAAGADPRQAAAAGILITPNLTPGTAVGRVALQVIALTGIPPTA